MADDRTGQRGFALLEVLVAFVIAAAALGILARSGSLGLSSVATAGRYEEATSRARSHLAAIGRNVSLDEGGYEGEDGGGYRWHIRVARMATAAPPPAAPSPDRPEPPAAAPPALAVLYAVTVTISWTENGREREVTLRTARTTARRQ